MTASIPAGLRADLDRELAGAIQSLLAKAADFDGSDVIEANVEFTEWLVASPLNRHRLAAAVAALALRIRRGGGDG